MAVGSTYMHNLGRHLSPWFRVFAPDLPGFGQSAKSLSRNAEVSISQLAKGLHDFMDAAGIQRIVMQGPTMDKSRQPAFKTLSAFLANGSNEPFTMSLIMWKDYWSAGWRRATMMFKNAMNHKLWDVLKEVKQPTLVLSFELDPIAPYRWCGEVSEELPNGVHYILSDAPHTLNYAATEKMSRIVLRYFLVKDDADIAKAGKESKEKIDHNVKLGTELAKRTREFKWTQIALLVTLLFANFTSYITPLQFLILLTTIKTLLLYHYLSTRNHITTQITPTGHLFIPLPGIADFDSASAMLRSLGRYLSYRDFPQLGVPTPLAPLMPLLNLIPLTLRNQVYALLGAGEATSNIVKSFSAQKTIYSVVEHFPPRRRYPAIAIGSSNGALTNLYAAMDIPWLPQTLLVPVKRPPESAIRQGEIDMTIEMEWGRKEDAEILKRNPEVELHHMANPNQDQLMIHRMAYCRLKLLKLPEAYRKFIEESLEEGGTLMVVRCGLKWLVTKVSERNYFQSGAIGGLEAEEFIDASEDVREPDCEAPEAEYDVLALAMEKGFKVTFVDFEQPEALLMTSFIVSEPFLTIRYNLTPYRSVFPVQPLLKKFEQYLSNSWERGKPYHQGLMMLFCSGVRSIGLADTEDWKRVLVGHLGHDGSGKEGESEGKLFLRTDEGAFPADFGFPALYQKELYQKELKKSFGVEGQWVLPSALGLAWVSKALTDGGMYGIEVETVE
ncbi:hypothetical protein HK097_008543 [Rhizophlyctis rosea]|uniref:Peptidase S33 tripeptidyl aminopeptidase-like C-terminal domain-containing protein n=1 Tax=Rhizophlyctis rosea TaxID=64517 RepID=A0AAD5SAB3_9FUNG|nr:hypothetical protein HK097_008543 [Rhizophlyctis rosea]